MINMRYNDKIVDCIYVTVSEIKFKYYYCTGCYTSGCSINTVMISATQQWQALLGYRATHVQTSAQAKYLAILGTLKDSA